MAANSPKTQRPGSAPTTQDILRVWRADRSIRASSAQGYLQWINRLRRYCRELGLDEADQLTRAGAERFRAWYATARRISATPLGGISSSMHALHRVYAVMGLPLTPWQPTRQRRAPATPLLRAYAVHLGQHRGNPESTVLKKLDHVGKLLAHLARAGKSWRRLSLPDIDAFLVDCASRYARTTTADIASTVRSFARFLLASGRIRVDLADAVISPVQPRFARPRRALPWQDVQRLLRAVDTGSAGGLRDHAMLLIRSSYTPEASFTLRAKHLA